ncbi:MAG: DUF1189 family protein [Nanoarchaeota archaeon]
MDFWKTILKTLYPDAYPGLLELPLRLAIGYFFRVLLLGVFIMLVVAVPVIFLSGATLQSHLASFDEFSVDANVSASRPIVLLDHPSIVIALDKNMSDERVLINKEGIFYKKFGFFGVDAFRFDTLKDVPASASDLSRVLVALAFLLLPSLVVFVFSWFTVKYVATVVVLALLAWVLVRLFKYRLPLVSLLKVGLYATTFVILLEVAIFPLWRLSWWPILVYVLFFVLVVALNAEPKGHAKPKKAKRDEPF